MERCAPSGYGDNGRARKRSKLTNQQLSGTNLVRAIASDARSTLKRQLISEYRAVYGAGA
jgi:hypothetical protein